MRIDELKKEKHLTDVDVVIIGGESVYRQFLPFCDTAQITWIDFPMWQTHTWLIWRKKAGNW